MGHVEVPSLLGERAAAASESETSTSYLERYLK